MDTTTPQLWRVSVANKPRNAHKRTKVWVQTYFVIATTEADALALGLAASRTEPTSALRVTAQPYGLTGSGHSYMDDDKTAKPETIPSPEAVDAARARIDAADEGLDWTTQS